MGGKRGRISRHERTTSGGVGKCFVVGTRVVEVQYDVNRHQADVSECCARSRRNSSQAKQGVMDKVKSVESCRRLVVKERLTVRCSEYRLRIPVPSSGSGRRRRNSQRESCNSETSLWMPRGTRVWNKPGSVTIVHQLGTPDLWGICQSGAAVGPGAVSGCGGPVELVLFSSVTRCGVPCLACSYTVHSTVEVSGKADLSVPPHHKPPLALNFPGCI